MVLLLAHKCFVSIGKVEALVGIDPVVWELPVGGKSL